MFSRPASHDPIPGEVEPPDWLDRAVTTSINPTRTTMIRPPATTTTDPGTRRPIDTSARPELENEATPGQERNRPRDGTNPISAHDGTNPISSDLDSLTDGTNSSSHDMGTILDGTKPISPQDEPDRATERSQFRGSPTRKEPPGKLGGGCDRASRTTSRISPKQPISPIIAYQRPIARKSLRRSGQLKPPSPWRWPWPSPWCRRRSDRCGRASCRR